MLTVPEWESYWNSLFRGKPRATDDLSVDGSSLMSPGLRTRFERYQFLFAVALNCPEVFPELFDRCVGIADALSEVSDIHPGSPGALAVLSDQLVSSVKQWLAAHGLVASDNDDSWFLTTATFLVLAYVKIEPEDRPDYIAGSDLFPVLIALSAGIDLLVSPVHLRSLMRMLQPELSAPVELGSDMQTVDWDPTTETRSDAYERHLRAFKEILASRLEERERLIERSGGVKSGKGRKALVDHRCLAMYQVGKVPLHELSRFLQLHEDTTKSKIDSTAERIGLQLRDGLQPWSFANRLSTDDQR